MIKMKFTRTPENEKYAVTAYEKFLEQYLSSAAGKNK